MTGWRRAVELVLPSTLASLVGGLAAGLADGALGAAGPVETLAAGGYVALVALPVGLLACLLARALLFAWRPRELVRSAVEEGGAAPRLAAWLLYLLLGGWLLAAATLNVFFLVTVRSPARSVQGLATAMAVTACAALLVLASLPVVRLLAAGLRRLDRLGRREGRGSLLAPRPVLGAAAFLAACLLWLGWKVSVRPRIGHLDLTPLFLLAGGGAAMVAVHLLWPALSRRGGARVLTAGVVAAGIAAMVAATWVRQEKPYAMLRIWGGTSLAGPVIDRLHRVQSLRRDLRLPELAPAAREDAPRHDVVLVTVDSFRADRSPPYGGPAKMPALAAFSRESTVFEWAFAAGNVTRRSLPTLATGLSPHRVRGRVAGWALRIDPRHVVLAERFREAGYATAGFFCCRSFFGPEHELGLIRGIDHLFLDKDGGALVEAAAAWKAADPDRPFFVWFHFIEPHGWQSDFPRGDRYGSTHAQRYDHSLAAVDGFFSRILELFLDQEGRYRTILAFTSDHGQGLGDHGALTHATNLTNSQIRIPMLLYAPGHRARRVPRPVGLVDLTPTLLDLAGFEPPGMPHMDGESLVPILRGGWSAPAGQGEAYAVMVADRSVERSAWAIVVGRYKLIEEGGGAKPKLFDILADPKERKNLASEKPEVVARLRARLMARRMVDRVSPF